MNQNGKDEQTATWLFSVADIITRRAAGRERPERNPYPAPFEPTDADHQALKFR